MTTHERWRSRWAVPAALVSAVTLFAPATASAHHSFAEYEDMRTSTLEGTVESFQWNNPHVVVKVLVKPDDHTDPQEWNVVTSSPAILTRFGWGQHSVKPGDRVSMICNPLRDGSHGCRLHTLVMPDTGQILKTKLSGS
jgi:Family of unknown function (DUF6152)